MEQSFMGIHTKACQQANHLLTGENWFSRIGGMQENLTKNNVENYIYKKKKLKKEKLMYSKKNFTIYWNSKLSKKKTLHYAIIFTNCKISYFVLHYTIKLLI